MSRCEMRKPSVPRPPVGLPYRLSVAQAVRAVLLDGADRQIERPQLPAASPPTFWGKPVTLSVPPPMINAELAETAAGRAALRTPH